MAVASGKPIPGKYSAMLQSILSIGLIQDIQTITKSNNDTISRKDLGLPDISKPVDPNKFQLVLSKLAIEKI